MVTVLDKFFDADFGQGVDQPRLPQGQFKDTVERSFGEKLPRLFCMLAEQRADFLRSEVAQGKRTHRNVERAGRVEVGRAARFHLVVAHVAQADEGDGAGKRGRALVEAGTELAQDRNQHLVVQRIDFVYHNNQWARRRQSPFHQKVTNTLTSRCIRFPQRWMVGIGS